MTELYILRVKAFSYFLILKNDFPHAEVEHGADIEDEEEGAHHGEGEHGGAGGAAVQPETVRGRAEHRGAGAGPRHRVNLEVRHWNDNELILIHNINILSTD